MFPAAGHMALAIEATRQYCEIKDIAIRGLNVRDLELKTALTVPEGDNGLEIQLRLAKNASSSESAPVFAFFVESYANDAWHLHSSGLISPVVSEKDFSEPADHPVNPAALTERHTGKRWNDTFKRVGFEYNGAFNALENIKTHEKRYEAAGEIPVKTTSGQVTEESRYVLHPSTVDCLLQLCIISIHAGRYQDMPWGVIPVKFEEVSFWFPSSADEATGHAVAWNDERGARARRFSTNSQLLTSDGQVVLDIKGLQTVSYEAALPPSKGVQVQPMPFAGVEWRPDVGTSSFGQAVAAYQVENSSLSSLSAVVELLNHNKPLSKVLLLLSPSAGGLDSVLQSLPSTAALNIAADFKETSEQRLESLKTRANLIDLATGSVIPEGIENGSQDLIVADTSIIKSGSLSDLKTLLREKGSLVFEIGNQKGIDAQNAIAATGLASSEVANRDSTLAICTPTTYANGHSSEEELTLAYSSAHSPPPEGLAHVLGSKYFNISIKEIGEIDVTTDKRIVLYNTSGNLLSHVTPEAFSAVTSIVPSGASVLWLTSGVNEGKCPQGALAQGFLRVVREEQKMAKATLLDVDRSESFESVSKAISSIFHAKEDASTAEEAEYWLHNGACHTSRVVPTKQINERMYAGSNAVIEAKLPRKQAYRALLDKGEVNFQPTDTLSKTLLGSHEIEIQVDALQFDKRDIQAEAEAPRLVSGIVTAVGSAVSGNKVGRSLVAFVSDPYQTTVRASEQLCVEHDATNGAGLVSSLPNICKALNALERANGALSKQHVLLLPSSKPVADAYAALSRALGFSLTLVHAGDASGQSYQQEKNITILKSTDAPAIRRLTSGAQGQAPTVIIASSFDTLSRDTWRNIPASASFVLSEGLEDSFEASPELAPFTRGATFSATSLASVFKSQPGAVGEVLAKAMDAIKARQITAPSVIAESLTTLETSPETASDKSVVSYPYESEVVKVSQQSFPGGINGKRDN